MYGKSALEKRQQVESKREMRKATSMTKTVHFLFTCYYISLLLFSLLTFLPVFIFSNVLFSRLYCVPLHYLRLSIWLIGKCKKSRNRRQSVRRSCKNMPVPLCLFILHNMRIWRDSARPRSSRLVLIIFDLVIQIITLPHFHSCKTLVMC